MNPKERESRDGDRQTAAQAGGEQQHGGAPEDDCRYGVEEEEDGRRHGLDRVHRPTQGASDRACGLDEKQHAEQGENDTEHDAAQPTAEEGDVGKWSRVDDLDDPFTGVPVAQVEGEEDQGRHEEPQHVAVEVSGREAGQ